MKLQLLLVLLAVAALAPDLTQGRVVSKCELKEKLGAALTLDEDLQKHKEHILAIVICEVAKWSHLNTSLVKVEGDRVAPTTAGPTTAAKVTKHSTARPEETTAEAKKSTPKAAKPKTTKPKTTKAAKTTTAETTTILTTTTAVPTSAESETTETNQTASPPSRRRKREVESPGEEDEDDVEDRSAERPKSLDELLNENDRMFDEEELMTDDNKMTKEKEEKEEEQEEEEEEEDAETSEMEEQTEADDDEDEEEDEDADNEDTDDQTSDDKMDEDEGEGAQTTEEDGDMEEKEEEEKKEEVQSEDVAESVPWSLGHYGLFQLTDSHFCDSGFRWSRNKCNTTCTVFADDDITDDIDCLVTSGYWRYLVMNASRRCSRSANFFRECSSSSL